MKSINNNPRQSMQSVLDRCLSVQIGVKPFLGPIMNHFLQLATALLLTTMLAPAQVHSPQVDKKQKAQREDVEWIWQYTPAPPDKDGRENALIMDPHFKPFLEQFFTAQQTFWGTPIDGRYRSLSNTILDHLSVPGKVIADDN